MAGSAMHLDVHYDDRRIMRVLQRLQDVAGDMAPALQDIGEHLMVSHDQRFRAQVGPDGRAWDSLSERYRARKKRNKNKILILDTHLSGLLHYQIEGQALRFGTALIYGATHQFGDARRNIPARPFLGISTTDEAVILDILQDHLRGALK